jgi:putative membrane protein
MKLTTLVNRVALVAALLGSSVALADKLDAGDLATVAHLHAVDQMEIQMGKLAQKNSSTAGVKAFGDTLVKDHTQNDKDLTALAKKRGASIPKDMPADAEEKQEAKDDMDAMNKLKTLKGAEFDRQFLAAMVGGHERELAKLVAVMGATKDDDLLALEKATQPVMESHASTAAGLQKNEPQAAK